MRSMRNIFISALRSISNLMKTLLPPWSKGGRGERFAIIPYRGFSGPHRALLLGRVIKSAAAERVERQISGRRKSVWNRISDVYAMLISKSIPETQVSAEFHNIIESVTTDSNGYFSVEVAQNRPTKDLHWQEAEFSLQSESVPEVRTRSWTAKVLSTPTSAVRLIISDIDDTVVETGVANKLRMIWNLFVIKAAQRQPFPGVAEFFRALHNEENPIIYISRGPWSIYPIIEEAFQLHGIPIGPILLLRDWGISYRHPLPRRAKEHKKDLIDRTLSIYPELPVIMIGDSGQQDPEIYYEAVGRHPGRVQGIYIRAVEVSRERQQEVEKIGEDIRKEGIPCCIAGQTSDWAEHAVGHEWIDEEQVRRVEKAVQKA